MQRRQTRYPMPYRRARALLWVIGLFWLWLCSAGAGTLEVLHPSPVHAVLALYALAVVVLVSVPAALLAGARMLLSRPALIGQVALHSVEARPSGTGHPHAEGTAS